MENVLDPVDCTNLVIVMYDLEPTINICVCIRSDLDPVLHLSRFDEENLVLTSKSNCILTSLELLSLYKLMFIENCDILQEVNNLNN